MINDIDFSKLEIDKENEIVRYNDKLHKYWVKGDLKPCISVTTLIHKFTTFDEKFWSEYKALEALMSEGDFNITRPTLLKTKIINEHVLELSGVDKEAFEKKKQEILDEWKEKREKSCERGSLIHKNKEDEHLSGTTPEIKKLGLGGNFKTNISNKLKLGEQNVYPEMLISYIDDDIRLAGQADLIIVDCSELYVIDYKGLDINTPILTTNGFKLLKNINKEDIIFDKDGNKTNILNISEIHYNPCYKIVFDNGDEIIADNEHRWLIADNYVFTTNELKNFYDSNKTEFLKINNCKPFDFETRQNLLTKNHLPITTVRSMCGMKLSKDELNNSHLTIVSIEPVPTIPTKCLEVDSPSHTFLFGESLIVTHNTNKEIKKKSYYDRNTKSSQMMKYPLNNLEDTNFWHYSLQLSTYAWMIEKSNPEIKVNKLIIEHHDHDGNCTTYECEYLKNDVERMLDFYKREVKYEELMKSREKITF